MIIFWAMAAIYMWAPRASLYSGPTSNLHIHFFLIFMLEQGWRKFLRARAKTADNFWEKFSRFWKY